MQSSLMHSSNYLRCSAFKAGPLRRTRLTRQALANGTVASARVQQKACPSSSQPVTEVARGPSGLISATALALLAGGALAGSSIAADGPDSAAQAVQFAKLASDILRPTFSIFTILYIIRIPMTWYPDIDGKKFPWALAYVPTEPILSVTRKVVPLVSGVDVSPIVWVGLLSFLNEILLGPQGLLTLIQARGGL